MQVARGSLSVNGQALSAGDAVQIVGEPEIVLADARDAEVLVFDLPK